MIIETKGYSCRKCQSEGLVKNGTNASGSSQYHCKACGAWGVLAPKERATGDMHGIERTFGGLRRTLSAWLKEQANDLPVIAKRFLCWRGRSCGPLSFVAKTKFGSGVP